MPAVVHGLRELNVAFAKADKETRRLFRAELRHVAAPVARTAETLAMENIRRMPRSPKWAKMRVGITRTLVYVAPRQRGVKRRGDAARRRPPLGTLLMDRAMEPALHRHAAEVEQHFEAALDRIADDFNRGGR